MPIKRGSTLGSKTANCRKIERHLVVKKNIDLPMKPPNTLMKEMKAAEAAKPSTALVG